MKRLKLSVTQEHIRKGPGVVNEALDILAKAIWAMTFEDFLLLMIALSRKEHQDESHNPDQHRQRRLCRRCHLGSY